MYHCRSFIWHCNLHWVLSFIHFKFSCWIQHQFVLFALPGIFVWRSINHVSLIIFKSSSKHCDWHRKFISSWTFYEHLRFRPEIISDPFTCYRHQISKCKFAMEWHQLNLHCTWIFTNSSSIIHHCLYPLQMIQGIFFYRTFCYKIWSLNPSGAEAWIFPESWVNAISADALGTFIARTSAAMMLTVHEKCLSRERILNYLHHPSRNNSAH